MSDALVRAYGMPFGFRATFYWRDQHLEVEWSPRFPRIKKHRAWRKFTAAYKVARRDFYTDISAMIGGNILVIDTDLKTIDGMEVITVPVKP